MGRRDRVLDRTPENSSVITVLPPNAAALSTDSKLLLVWRLYIAMLKRNFLRVLLKRQVAKGTVS